MALGEFRCGLARVWHALAALSEGSEGDACVWFQCHGVAQGALRWHAAVTSGADSGLAHWSG
jgi:hypothetical protein